MVGCCARKSKDTETSTKIFTKMAKMKMRTPEDVRAKALVLTHLNQDSAAFELLLQNEKFQSIPYGQQRELCSTELLKQNLSKLPNMQLTASLKEIRNNKNPIYFVACDQAYFDKFFEKSHDPVWKECPKQRIHVHFNVEPQ